MNKNSIIYRDIGLVPYQAAWDYQEQLLQENVRKKSLQFENGINEDTTNYLLLLEHPPVYTLGKSGNIENVLISDEMRTMKGIEFFRTNRGGDITFHGPGQIVGYPILDLEKFGTDIGKYLRNLEEVIICALHEYGIEAGRSPGETGVWLDVGKAGFERKICAIGVRTSRWITMHGFAFNVNPDLDFFNFIVPCGIQDKKVTSLEKELGHKTPLEEVKRKLLDNFSKVFNADILEDRKEVDQDMKNVIKI